MSYIKLKLQQFLCNTFYAVTVNEDVKIALKAYFIFFYRLVDYIDHIAYCCRPTSNSQVYLTTLGFSYSFFTQIERRPRHKIVVFIKI